MGSLWLQYPQKVNVDWCSRSLYDSQWHPNSFEVRLKCSKSNWDVFERQLKYSDGIRNAFQLIIFCIEIGFDSNRGAFDLYSFTFEMHSGHSWRIRSGLSILIFTRTYSECYEFCWVSVRMLRMPLECSTNALQLLFDIFPLRMHFDVDGMYLEFSFEPHSGSFRLPCD